MLSTEDLMGNGIDIRADGAVVRHYPYNAQPSIPPKDFSDDLALMQFTGLLDKNGKEIYEGDLCKVLDRDWPSQLDSHPELDHQQYLDSISSICEVVWDKGNFWLEQRKGRGYYYPQVSSDRRRDVFEVIGNIYENSELLK
jgi:uncharacterized phage protein (TIGR01671 family)